MVNTVNPAKLLAAIQQTLSDLVVECETCGEVEHQPIPEDRSHCPCESRMMDTDPRDCDCPCHGAS